MQLEKLKKMFSENKKAAIGATMTWVVATVIILFVIILFIYASYAITKEKKIKNLEPFVQEIEQSSCIDSEQMLLALMQTKLEEKAVEDYILEGNYDELEIKIKPILDELPNFGADGWVLKIYENSKSVKEIKGTAGVVFFKSRKTWVYLGSNKKAELFLNLWE